MESVERTLAAASFCEGMDAQQVALIAKRASERRLFAGEFVFHEGEDALALYIIVEGSVSLEVSAPERGALVFQTIGRGDALGLSWLFPPHRWHFDARAVEDTLLVVVDAAWLRETMEADQDFGYEILKRVARVMIGRLQATRLQMTDMYGG